MDDDAKEHPKLQALGDLIKLCNTSASDCNVNGARSLAAKMRQRLKEFSDTPNLYDLSTDLNSIESLITELEKPKVDIAETCFTIDGRVHSLYMRVFQMLLDEGKIQPG